MTRARILLPCLLLGCGALNQKPPLPPLPAPSTKAQLASSFCQGQSCRCHSADGAVGAPVEGAKRYQFLFGPSNGDQWITIGDRHVLHKGGDRPVTCYYVDLAPGEHKVAFHASAPGGVSAYVRIQERGGDEDSEWWYSTLEFACGNPGFCDAEDLRQMMSRLEQAGPKVDPCGSTQIKQYSWQSGPSSDGIYPDRFMISATLKVYQFTPEHPPLSPQCQKEEE